MFLDLLSGFKLLFIAFWMILIAYLVFTQKHCLSVLLYENIWLRIMLLETTPQVSVVFNRLHPETGAVIIHLFWSESPFHVYLMVAGFIQAS